MTETFSSFCSVLGPQPPKSDTSNTANPHRIRAPRYRTIHIIAAELCRRESVDFKGS